MAKDKGASPPKGITPKRNMPSYEELMRVGTNKEGKSVFKNKKTRDAALHADRSTRKARSSSKRYQNQK
jgi:hypothetical protein